MAAKPAPKKAPKAPAKPAAGKSKGGGLGMRLAFVLIIAVMFLFFMPTVVLLAFAMLPTMVAVVVDRSPDKLSAFTIGGFNFAGVAPYLLDLWFGEHNVTVALDTLSDLVALIVIYGASALGWVLHFSAPAVVGTYMALTSTQRLARFKAEQKQLVELWGPEVTTLPKPPKKKGRPAG
ncbi:hypothetical protein [Roseospirillum parvum]|uniref:Uncharacterized protein n=1 Tax=Roseospirillum parvum TaxID=83401 RepID=A0A1G7XJZ7_9PROT|nr:hypothetical protein [Roseospirillum parvum]SDG84565.1 hypothetical protein SAMN05421742_10312 [Roseospirillum parvum]